MRRGTEHNKYLSRLFAGCDLFAGWHASFVSGMMVRLVDSSNISASHHYCTSRGSGVYIEPRPILQLMNVLAALVEFRIKQSSVLLHQARATRGGDWACIVHRWFTQARSGSENVKVHSLLLTQSLLHGIVSRVARQPSDNCKPLV